LITAGKKSLGESTLAFWTWFLVGLAFTVSFASISAQSLWIDEGNSAYRAIQPTLADFWATNIQFGGSDLQMPGYMLSLWTWEKIFGSSEYALRAMNIPFFLVSVFSALFLFKTPPSTRLPFALLLCLSPMVWIYMDEARPYIFQLTGATLVLIGMVDQGKNPARIKKNLLVFCLGILILSVASLTGVVFAFFFGLGFLGILLHQKTLSQIFSSRRNLAILALSLIALLGLGAYYFWTLQMGVGASNAASTSLSSLAFAFYELWGFMGFGPGRLELRSEGVSALQPFLPWIAAFAIIVFLFATASFHNLIIHRPPIWVWIITTAALGAGVCMITIGITKDFRIIGRHLMPLLPFLLLFMAWGLGNLWLSAKKPQRILVAIFCCMLLISSLSARAGNRFQKDDYRSAAKLAQSYLEQGKIVWWAADEPSALYYIPDVESHITSQYLFLAFGPRATLIELRKKPNLILLSKPDIYDQDQAILSYARKNQLKKIAEIKSFLPYAAD
jgi:hypothetical protein